MKQLLQFLSYGYPSLIRTPTPAFQGFAATSANE
ncbi:hypothetical protein PSYMO_38613, partial [Pseudomonas amygdali pv. mori str. 301020]